MAPKEAKPNNHDARICPTFNGDDPSEYEQYIQRMTCWLLTQSEDDRKNGVTLGRAMSALEGKALKTMMDVIPEDEIVKYKVEGGMKLWLDKLRDTCGKPQSEDLQDLFREFFFKSKIKNDEKFSDWLLRFELLEKKVTKFQVVLPPELLGWWLLNRSGLNQEKRSFIISQADSPEYDAIKPYLQKMKSTLDERPEKSSRRTSTRWTGRRSRFSRRTRKNDAFAASEEEDSGEGYNDEEEEEEE